MSTGTAPAPRRCPGRHTARIGAGRTAATLALLGLAGCGSSGPATAPGRTTLAPFRGPGFTVGLPAKPKKVTVTVAADGRKLRLRIYLVKAGNTVFEVGEVGARLPAGSLTDGLVGASAGSIHRTTTTYAGLPVTDVRVNGLAGRKATLFARELTGAHRTVMLLYIVANMDLQSQPPGAAQFAASLQIR